MYDKKQIRRRRAILGALVAVSLILLTAYFGESPSSPLHQVQRGIVAAVSPVQKGASTVLSPVRDVAGWFSGTLKAKSQVKHYRNQVAGLKLKVAELQQAAIDNRDLTAEVKLDQKYNIGAYGPVAANVIGRDPQVWYQTIEVDKGSDSGVQLNDPVVGQDGLVGKVTTVTGGASLVTEITDHSFEVAATVQNNRADSGSLVPETGNQNSLLLQYLPADSQISTNQLVVTQGVQDTDGSTPDLYPPGIPIGTVSNANQNTLINQQQVTVTPVVDLRHLTSVQILTKLASKVKLVQTSPSQSAQPTESAAVTGTGTTQTTPGG